MEVDANLQEMAGIFTHTVTSICTVVPHLYAPQLYGSPDYTDPISPQINTILTCIKWIKLQTAPIEEHIVSLHGHFTHTDQSRSHGVRISEGPLYSKLTSGITYCPDKIRAPRMLSRASFLSSDIGT